MQRQQLNLEESLLQSENKNHCEGRCRKDRTSHKNKCRKKNHFFVVQAYQKEDQIKEPPKGCKPNMTEDVINPIKEALPAKPQSCCKKVKRRS